MRIIQGFQKISFSRLKFSFLFVGILFSLFFGNCVFSYGQITFIDNLYGVSVLGKDMAWVAGSAGQIFHTTDGGVTWSEQKTDTVMTLYDVDFVDQNVGWAVGEFATILKTEDGGKHWTRCSASILSSSNINRRVTDKFFKVFAVDRRDVWVVGEWGTILHSEDGGASWRLMRKREDFIVNDISFLDKKHGLVVGEFSTVLYTQDGGNSWLKLKLPFEDRTFYGVHFAKAEEAWICGIDTTLVKLSGNGLEDEVVRQFKPKVLLHSIKARNGYVVAVGNEGSMFFSSDNGVTWNKIHLPKIVSLCEVELIETRNKIYCWAVGTHGFVKQWEVKGESLEEVKLPRK